MKLIQVGMMKLALSFLEQHSGSLILYRLMFTLEEVVMGKLLGER